MDHRCLYGHRVTRDQIYAIDRRICPVCGAATVSVEGYQLARRLCSEVPLQAVDAFNTVLFLEKHFTVSPRGAETPRLAPVPVPELGDDPTAEATGRQVSPDEKTETLGHAMARMKEVGAADEPSEMSEVERTFFRD